MSHVTSNHHLRTAHAPSTSGASGPPSVRSFFLCRSSAITASMSDEALSQKPFLAAKECLFSVLFYLLVHIRLLRGWQPCSVKALSRESRRRSPGAGPCSPHFDTGSSGCVCAWSVRRALGRGNYPLGNHYHGSTNAYERQEARARLDRWVHLVRHVFLSNVL